GISLSERIPAAAGIVNLRYKSCPEMAGQDQLNFVNLLIKQMLSMLNRQLVKIFLTVYIGGKMCEDLTTVSQRGRQIDNGLEFKCELQGFCIAVFGGKDRVLRFIIP
ncbi:hypothetical protein, partial [Citrobacter youngae]|uniref:hypothetical protein n=1 Tax=Citrobacter youngae TaxID=133448 RepID=UPI003EE3EDD7